MKPTITTLESGGHCIRWMRGDGEIFTTINRKSTNPAEAWYTDEEFFAAVGCKETPAEIGAEPTFAIL